MLTYLTTHLQSFTKQMRRDDRGATMVEYGLLVALIAVVVAVAATVLGNDIAALFTSVSDTLFPPAAP
jgi:pilus assembly protein Flp/PilA